MNSAPRHPVLIVDDVAAMRRVLAAALLAHGLDVVEAEGASEAVAVARSRPLSAVVLDNRLRDGRGIDVVRDIRRLPNGSTLPIILLTADAEVADRIAGLGAGADDYLTKPFDVAELVARVDARLRGYAAWAGQISEHLAERSAVAAALGRLRPDRDPEDTAAAICHEVVTLPSVDGVAVVGFTDAGVATPLASSGECPWRVAPGVALPAAVAASLAERATRGPWVEALDDASELRDLACAPDRPTVSCAPLLLGGRVVGALLVAAADQGAWAATTPAADRALAVAIDFSGLAAGLLGPALLDRSELAVIRAELQRVIAERSFAPVFQPIVRLDDLGIVGFEALTRFGDDTPPATRFAEAGALGMGIDLELATLEAALAAADPLPDDSFLSLNVSPSLVVHGDPLAELVDRGGSRPIVLELTEHDEVADYGELRDALDVLRPRLRVSIDDAGSGFASLRHVLALEPSFMKLDQSWVTGVDGDPAKQALIAGLAHFADATGCRLIAEGIESEVERDVLRDLDAELGQGFHLGRPAPVAT